ncbi:MAG: PSD1 and planctomycete cytochrome C domain-containing protein [Phycisphaerae bacterium]|nr:PSD1 and planctomycete cytochrome C domain-containing protein [Phycisphaerae bacterium]
MRSNRPLPFLFLSLTVMFIATGLGASADDEPMQDMQGMSGGETAPAKELTERERQFFENKVRPVLVEHCYGCHSSDATKIRGGFLLDTRDSLLAGGDTGAAIVPGKPNASPLIKAVRWTDEDFAMPPKKKLPDEAIRALEEWVAMGAPDPRFSAGGTLDTAGPAITTKTWDIEKSKDFWAFKPPVKPTVPTVARGDWPTSDIDRFVLAKMEAHFLAPIADADRRTWLRRVTFDLTGLPPTLEEIAAFEKDPSDGAFEKVTDRLLASSAFGERWGRHWLDVARYAESSGKENNVLYPHAWRYRDYVVASFNADKPYDEFLREQIAGDLLVAKDANDRAENLVATAYLAIGAKGHNTQNPRQFIYDVVDEQIDALTQGTLGLTVACARCHDHKFDPIPQKDYYAIAGVFLSSSTQFGTYQSPGNRHASTLIRLPKEAQVVDGATMSAERRTLLARAQDRLADEATKAADNAQAARQKGESKDAVNMFKVVQLKAQANTLDSILERFDSEGRPTTENRVTMGMLDGQRVIEANILQRGEIDKPAERVERGVVQVIAGEWVPEMPSDGSGRLELSQWIANARNPLTARVWVNRVWLHLFGKGIVPTPDNFGHSGVAPTNPELLDFLATRLIDEHWSTKQLIRDIVLSRTYRLSSAYNKANADKDPDVIWLWRMPKKRLEGEAVRDAMLASAGTLDRTVPNGSPINFAEGAMRGGDNKLFAQLTQESRPIRSVYLPIVRDKVPEVLDVFDFADPAFVTGDRDETNVATQALYMMNSPEVMQAADAFTDRILAGKGSDAERIGKAFEIALGRKATSQEILASREFVNDFKKTLAKDPAPNASKDSAGGGDERGPLKRVRDRMAQNRAMNGGDRGAEKNTQLSSSESAINHKAWSAFCQSLFQTAEFRTID